MFVNIYLHLTEVLNVTLMCYTIFNDSFHFSVRHKWSLAAKIVRFPPRWARSVLVRFAFRSKTAIMSQVRPSFFPIWVPTASRRRPDLTYVLLMIPVAGFQQASVFSKTSRNSHSWPSRFSCTAALWKKLEETCRIIQKRLEKVHVKHFV